MNDKIKELTEQIYKEGIERGNAQGEEIVANARQKGEEIIKEAQEKAEKLLSDKAKECEELRKKAEADLRLSASQAVNALKGTITDMLSSLVIDKTLGGTLRKGDFLFQFLMEMAKEWGKREQLVVETPQKEKLLQFFSSHCKELLDQGLEIKDVQGREGTFSISPAGGSYKIRIGEEELKGYFKSFLRPQLAEILFQPNK